MAVVRRYGEEQRRTEERDLSDQTDGGCQKPAPEQAAVLRAWAAQERDRAEQLATFLEDVAVNGLPRPEDCTPWEELRDRRLAELGGTQ
ncbi:hypothetical protein ACIRPK_35810 [Kitasatospora sp. NPDC101801]|uniref:hypothetical protein n=1 Tax=Kitasatospora sp. NPDC101801 TaxID=3364103 RepID=UPI00380A5203